MANQTIEASWRDSGLKRAAYCPRDGVQSLFHMSSASLLIVISSLLPAIDLWAVWDLGLDMSLSLFSIDTIDLCCLLAIIPHPNKLFSFTPIINCSSWTLVRMCLFYWIIWTRKQRTSGLQKVFSCPPSRCLPLLYSCRDTPWLFNCMCYLRQY